MGWLSRLLGKSDPESVGPESDGEDQKNDEQEFVDVDLPIESVVQTDGMFRITARGKVGPDLMGIVVTFGAEWEQQTMEDTEFVAYWGYAELSSLGAPSDCLVRHLASRYELNLAESPTMVEGVAVRVVGLHSDPSRMAETPVHTKVFFHADADDSSGFEQRYAELFVNVDLAQSVLQLHEKDTGYRKALVRALTQV